MEARSLCGLGPLTLEAGGRPSLQGPAGLRAYPRSVASQQTERLPEQEMPAVMWASGGRRQATSPFFSLSSPGSGMS